MNANLFQLIDEGYEDKAKIAIETSSGECQSYETLALAAGRFANAIRAAGVTRGDRVAVQAEKSVSALLLYLACLRAGAVFLPLNTAYTLTELDYFLKDAEPKLVVCDPAIRDEVARLAEVTGGRVETLDCNGHGTLAVLAAKQSEHFVTIQTEPDDLAAILYTSGTTGRSKGAMLTHGNLFSNAAVLKDYWNFRSSDVLIHMLPIYHAHGLFVAVNVSLLAGASMIFCRRFDSEVALRLLPRATVMMGIPTFYTRLLRHEGLGRAMVGNMRLFISGSAPLLAETHREWLAKTGHAILERYGMTETGMNTSNPYDGDRVAGTVGLPLPGIEVRVSDPESGAELALEEIGILEVRGPNVFKGYWRMPEKTRAEIRPNGFFVTGDLGKIDERGYVHIVGRGKDLIISGGFNVYPKEVESEIDLIPGVVESAVIGLPHPDFGEAVTAVVVRDGGSLLDEAVIKGALERRLAKFKQPKKVIFVSALPRNAMGKIQKNVLREANAGIYGSTS